MIIDNCNKCGAHLPFLHSHEVTCKHITFWEHDTKRYLCDKCYKKFQKYMKKNYDNFFIYLNKEVENGN